MRESHNHLLSASPTKAKKDHTEKIGASNIAAKGFKDSIVDLAKAKKDLCKVTEKVAALAAVKKFNEDNTSKAKVHRLIETIKCKVKSMKAFPSAKKTTTNEATCILKNVKAETHYHTTIYPNLDEPSVICPTTTKYR